MYFFIHGNLMMEYPQDTPFNKISYSFRSTCKTRQAPWSLIIPLRQRKLPLSPSGEVLFNSVQLEITDCTRSSASRSSLLLIFISPGTGVSNGIPQNNLLRDSRYSGALHSPVAI